MIRAWVKRSVFLLNILISTYNGANFIEEQLDSIFSQTYQDFYVYIRDDGSTDNTVTIISEYVEKHRLNERVTLISGDNIGFSQSFFALLHMAKDGDYWAFCDQDDVWLPDKLRLAVHWMEGKENQEIPLLYHSGFQLGNADLSEKTVYRQQKFKYCFSNSITSNLFFGFAITINRPLYERLLLANPEVIKYHDWFAAMITAAFGYYHSSHQISAIHRQHKDNSSPLFFFSKIPHGIRLLKGDLFYTRNAREFMRLFGEELSEKDREILSWFLNERYSLKTACKKAFYLHRWNPQLLVELVLRGLMLIGKV